MTPAKRAREQAGLTIEEAARKARVCPAYIRRAESGRGAVSYSLAMRLSRLYGCSANAFLLKLEGGATAQSEARTARIKRLA